MKRPSLTALIAPGALVALSLSVPCPALALTYYLSGDLGVHGLFRFCEYSNGLIYSFNASQLCPLRVQENGPPGVGGGSMVGFKAGEYRGGMTKVCVYNVMGTSGEVRIGATDVCPLTYNFQAQPPPAAQTNPQRSFTSMGIRTDPGLGRVLY